MGRILRATLLATMALGTLTPAASAATHLGSNFVPANLCSPDTTYIQTVSNGPLYSAPFSGVITSWSFQPGASVPTTMKLKVGRIPPGANLATDTNITIVGESASETPTGSTLQTFPARIPVQTGDVIGDYLNASTNVNCGTSDTAYTDHYYTGDAALGSTHSFFAENFQEDIAAILEPDADHDGFGDNTQDQCPTDPSTQGPCPVTPAPKKHCKHKKKHKSGAVIAKKCKKKHHRLSEIRG